MAANVTSLVDRLDALPDVRALVNAMVAMPAPATA
jgi:hypothetical protein